MDDSAARAGCVGRRVVTEPQRARAAPDPVGDEQRAVRRGLTRRSVRAADGGSDPALTGGAGAAADGLPRRMGGPPAPRSGPVLRGGGRAVAVPVASAEAAGARHLRGPAGTETNPPQPTDFGWLIRVQHRKGNSLMTNVAWNRKRTIVVLALFLTSSSTFADRSLARSRAAQVDDCPSRFTQRDLSCRFPGRSAVDALELNAETLDSAEFRISLAGSFMARPDECPRQTEHNRGALPLFSSSVFDIEYYEGRCSFSGTIHYSPNVGDSPQYTYPPGTPEYLRRLGSSLGLWRIERDRFSNFYLHVNDGGPRW